MTSSDAGKAFPPRQLSSVVIIDTNIVLGLVLGRGFRAVFERTSATRKLKISDRAVEEIRGVLGSRRGLSDVALEVVDDLLAGIEVVDREVYSSRVDGAAQSLRQAIPSRNGSERDAHLLACAWAYDADIWTHDRDIAGTGWPSWSTANLRDVLDGDRTRIAD